MEQILKESESGVRGREVIKQAFSFLRQMRFSANRGATAHGEHVAVSIDPRWNESDTISVLVTCYAFGHRTVDWEGLPIFIRPEGSHSDAGWVRFFDARGQVSFPRLPPVHYRVEAAWQCGISSDSFLLGRDDGWSRSYPSNDKSIQVTVGERGRKQFGVVAESDRQDFEGRTVRCCCIDPTTGEVLRLEDIKLLPVKGQRVAGKHFEKSGFEAGVAQESRLVFWVLPTAEPEE